MRIFSDPLALRQGCHQLRELSGGVPSAARSEYLQQLQAAEAQPDRFLRDSGLQEQFIKGVGHRSVLLRTPLLFSNPEHDGGLEMGYSRPLQVTIGDETTIVQEQERNFRVYDAEQKRHRVTLGVPVIDWKVVLNSPEVLSVGNHAKGYMDHNGTIVIANGDTNAFASLLLQQRFPELARRALITDLEVRGPTDLWKNTPPSLQWYVVKPRPEGTWMPLTKVLALTDKKPTMDRRGRLNLRHRDDGERFVVDQERLPNIIKSVRSLIYSGRRRSVAINPRSLLIDMKQGEVCLGERVDHVLLEGDMAVDRYGEVRLTMNPLEELSFRHDTPYHIHRHLYAQAENLLGAACAEVLDDIVKEHPERLEGLNLSYRGDPSDAIFTLIASFADIDPTQKIMNKLQPRWDRQEITTVQLETAKALLYDAMSAQADAALRSLVDIELPS